MCQTFTYKFQGEISLGQVESSQIKSLYEWDFHHAVLLFMVEEQI